MESKFSKRAKKNDQVVEMQKEIEFLQLEKEVRKNKLINYEE
jgi:hypothetical protein